MIDEVMTESGITKPELTAIAVGRGPGPFTGLRVGLVTARTLALALGLEVHGVTSLDAVALQAVDAGIATVGTDFIVATDARRREVYWARYHATETSSGLWAVPVTQPDVSRPHELPLNNLPCAGRGPSSTPTACRLRPSKPLRHCVTRPQKRSHALRWPRQLTDVDRVTLSRCTSAAPTQRNRGEPRAFSPDAPAPGRRDRPNRGHARPLGRDDVPDALVARGAGPPAGGAALHARHVVAGDVLVGTGCAATLVHGRHDRGRRGPRLLRPRGVRRRRRRADHRRSPRRPRPRPRTAAAHDTGRPSTPSRVRPR